jgi:hypothetical protein
VRLYSRPGNDMTRRFPLIAEALTGLRSRSCIIDGEASQAGVPAQGLLQPDLGYVSLTCFLPRRISHPYRSGNRGRGARRTQ